MMRFTLSLLLFIVPAAALGQSADEAFFEAKIRPVLAATCFKCHGGAKTSHDLRVDSREALLRGGENGPALKPGDPERSLLLQAMRHGKGELKMPPDRKLPDHVVADFATWIKNGAVWPKGVAAKAGFAAEKHWAFQPVKALPPPEDPSGWAQQPIDCFIAAKLRSQGLAAVGPADRRTLLRRATFDLIGLPPSAAEIDAFLGDASCVAYERVVDRLLASPRYGERWGRHWMDVVRYADTAGDNADYPIPEIHRYRDWIIDAFNADMPFDQFAQEQLAGDLLARQGPAQKYAESVVATGFLALSRRYATAPYEFWHLSLEDAIDTTGQAFLGLTLRCARCHDHKFDPVTREDYYGLYAIFASTVFPYAGSEEFASRNTPRQHFVPLEADARAKLAGYHERLQELAAALASNPKAPGPLREEQRLLLRMGSPPGLPVAYAVHDGKPVEVRIQLQGDPDRLGAVAPRRVPKLIEGAPVLFPPDGSGRLELARWLTRPDNPLTARVLVNRVWQHHFGRGLVPTPNNFGIRGEPPSHPELLDHLTAQFVRHGWSIKWLHRYILLSKTYQLASTPSPDLVANDPANVWLGRQTRRRLDAESIRDALLAVGGTLDPSRPGPHPFPPIATWGWTQHNPFKANYPSSHRSVYLMTQRFQKHPFLALFDGPDTNVSTGNRSESLLPLQALYLMNDPFVRAQAEGFAHVLLQRAGDAERRIDWAHRLAWARPATPGEIKKGMDFVQRYADELHRAGAPAERVELEAWTSYARVMLTANEFVFVD
jgi:cytochrome c553